MAVSNRVYDLRFLVVDGFVEGAFLKQNKGGIKQILNERKCKPSLDRFANTGKGINNETSI